ncbi:DUF2512 family protein [Thalassobacillus devorans]|uniref:DUF2512 family protein n=1 Tax=Thalassobacillus devorans TaxID=279813 RepID=UPI00048CA841|nr:DUF2512 family protein [Thalassobacillus devorans]
MEGFIRKAVMNAIIIVPMLMWFSEATFLKSVITGLILSFLTYFVGDRGILTMSNNITATVADGVLAYIYFWGVAEWMGWALSAGEIFFITALLAVVEYVFHRQLVRLLNKNEAPIRQTT